MQKHPAQYIDAYRHALVWAHCSEADLKVPCMEIRMLLSDEGYWCAGISQSQTRLADVGLVVLDEVHYLGDPSRGSVWEEVIINCPKHIQLCAMSATVANADALGGWIHEVREAML